MGKVGGFKRQNTTPSFSVDKNSGTWYDHKALRKGKKRTLTTG
jgi:hypothetical protein